ncbi:hypothetical protein NQ314_003762 [Rhamnusium bicolor]|uniref:Uncharacterized protein n=1 Tax=Rhamnusium bicolor TaxID=1586634 RepID=A0AAV8ZL63_9CUCU|nr:hypothetical protein NQ314_003762 [Rhamnusium bicolor]
MLKKTEFIDIQLRPEYPVIHIPEDHNFPLPEIRELQDDPDITLHISNEPDGHGIPILDEIINNKPFQIIVERNPHHKLKITNQTYDGQTIKNVKIPLHSPDLVTELLRDHTDPSRINYYIFMIGT